MAIIKYSGYRVRLPKGRKSLSDHHEAAIQDLMSAKKPVDNDGCTIVLYHDGSKNPLAVQRCEHRKLKGHNKKQCKASKANPRTGVHKGQFVACR